MIGFILQPYSFDLAYSILDFAKNIKIQLGTKNASVNASGQQHLDSSR